MAFIQGVPAREFFKNCQTIDDVDNKLTELRNTGEYRDYMTGFGDLRKQEIQSHEGELYSVLLFSS